MQSYIRMYKNMKTRKCKNGVGETSCELANDFKDKKCARCFQPIEHGHTVDAVYEDGEWYHRRCLEEGKRQFAAARKQAHLA